MAADLLLEIGCEEIPAGFLRGALPELSRRATELLAGARLHCERVSALGSPRRLALLVRGLDDRQRDLDELVVGPPASVAWGADGQPSKALLGFASKNGVDPGAVRRAAVDGKKGEYAVCVRREAGRPAREVLPALLSELVASLPWPKSMRWGQREERFVRPVHWLVALLGGELLPVEFAGAQAQAASRGHRFLAPDPVPLDGSLDGYVEALRQRFVIVDPEARRTMISAELVRIEREVAAVRPGVRVRRDEALLDEVCNLVEYPVAVCGEFDASYLEVPQEVIVSAMRSHLRYFAMEDERGALVNRFVTIAGTVTESVDKVRSGNQRVLAARLADARFFFREDRKQSLELLAGRLDGVVFQARLGSVGDKTRRVAGLARELAAALVAQGVTVSPEHCERAARLGKADLLTSMVGEFPELQGVMGRHYARLAGEPEPVCAAIEEQYLPRGSGDRLPGTAEGAVVGIADRIDTLVGGFAAGLAPTGSADPYGLRRAAMGVLALLEGRGWSLSLADMLARAARGLAGVIEVSEAHQRDVLELFRTRLRSMLGDAGLPGDCVEAALAAGFVDVPDARARAEAVARLRKRADFEPLAVAFKRVANILPGSLRSGEAAAPDPGRFVAADERALWNAFLEVHERVSGRLGERDYHGALQVLAELKGPVDRFFEAVLVMDQDERVRGNRLAMLGQINATFTRIADFRQLAV
jgi:glycyl-tRNA synthetase beta chain